MAFLLCLYKITAILLWSVFIALLSAPYQLKGGWKNIRKISRFVQMWNKGIAKIINLRVKISGGIPQVPGGLVISNHLGYLDIITHGSVLPLRYSPKAEIAKWPVLGWYLGLSRPIWTKRESRQASKKTLRDFTKTMKQGMYLVVYPEGTSSNGKNGILPFKSTSFEAAIVGNMPILPVLTRYKESPRKPPVCWYGSMTLLPHIWQVLKLPSIEAELQFLQPVFPSGMPRKELASFVHGIMEREYAKNFSLQS